VAPDGTVIYRPPDGRDLIEIIEAEEILHSACVVAA
jgi:hypothetical protein